VSSLGIVLHQTISDVPLLRRLLTACRYKNQAALDTHTQSEAYAKVQKAGAESQLLAAAPDTKVLGLVMGFASR